MINASTARRQAGSARRATLGFGFFPAERELHFQVTTGGPGQAAVVTEHDRVGAPGVARIEILGFVWARIAQPITATLNARLTRHGDRPGRFKARGATPLDWHAGKELMVLAWALEHVTSPEQIADVERAVSNWQGMWPETRWFFYTETNAASGGPEWRGRGWRAALYHILVENPIGRPDLDVLPPTPLPPLPLDDASCGPLPWRKVAAGDPAARLINGATDLVSLASGPVQLWISAAVSHHRAEPRAFVAARASIWIGDHLLADAVTMPGWLDLTDCEGEVDLTALSCEALREARSSAAEQVCRVGTAARDFARLNRQLLGIVGGVAR